LIIQLGLIAVMFWKMQVLFPADVLSLAATMMNGSATAVRLSLGWHGSLRQAVQALHALLKDGSAKQS
jgi:hypothetical protein